MAGYNREDPGVLKELSGTDSKMFINYWRFRLIFLIHQFSFVQIAFTKKGNII